MIAYSLPSSQAPPELLQTLDALPELDLIVLSCHSADDGDPMFAAARDGKNWRRLDETLPICKARIVFLSTCFAGNFMQGLPTHEVTEIVIGFSKPVGVRSAHRATVELEQLVLELNGRAILSAISEDDIRSRFSGRVRSWLKSADLQFYFPKADRAARLAGISS